MPAPLERVLPRPACALASTTPDRANQLHRPAVSTVLALANHTRLLKDPKVHLRGRSQQGVGVLAPHWLLVHGMPLVDQRQVNSWARRFTIPAVHCWREQKAMGVKLKVMEVPHDACLPNAALAGYSDVACGGRWVSKKTPHNRGLTGIQPTKGRPSRPASSQTRLKILLGTILPAIRGRWGRVSLEGSRSSGGSERNKSVRQDRPRTGTESTDAFHHLEPPIHDYGEDENHDVDCTGDDGRSSPYPLPNVTIFDAPPAVFAHETRTTTHAAHLSHGPPGKGSNEFVTRKLG